MSPDLDWLDMTQPPPRRATRASFRAKTKPAGMTPKAALAQARPSAKGGWQKDSRTSEATALTGPEIACLALCLFALLYVAELLASAAFGA